MVLMDYFKSLPLEIMLDIFSRVLVESVLECKSVSKTWNNVVSHPSFSKMHLHHSSNAADDSGELGFLVFPEYDSIIYYFEYNENVEPKPIQRIKIVNTAGPFRSPDFVDSSNGLICFARGPSVWICNPVTREYVALPDINRDCSHHIQHSDYADWTTGFGYVSSTDEYKVVGMYTGEIEFVEAYIYTLGSGKGWRNLGKFSSFESEKLWGPATVFANGALYLLDNEFDRIIGFDLAEEKFCENLSPPPLPQDKWDDKIGVLDGFLYFATCLDGIGCLDDVRDLDVDEYEGFDIWLLNKKIDNRDKKEHQSLGWSKQFRIPDGDLLAVTKGGGVLTYRGHDLHIYDTETSTSIELVRFERCLSRVSRHKKSLISLKDLGEEDIKRMESAEIEETRSRGYSIKEL